MRPSERHLALLMRTVEVKFGGARASSTPVRGNARVERKPPASSRSSKPRAARDFTSNKGQALPPRQRTGTHTKDRHSYKGQAYKGVQRTGVQRTGVQRTGVQRTGVQRTGMDRKIASNALGEAQLRRCSHPTRRSDLCGATADSVTDQSV